MNRYTTSGTAQRQSVSRGESLIGVTFLDEFVSRTTCRCASGNRVALRGHWLQRGAMSIVKGARNLAEAKRFYDWALTADAQTIRDQTR